MSSESQSSNNEKRSVFSELPLMFAGGDPLSLETATVKQLETFIPFMMSCSLGKEYTRVPSSAAPVWWPQAVKYKLPLQRSIESKEEWLLLLKGLVTCCYTYHNSTFMLDFCAYISKTPICDLKFIDLHDGRTSLYVRESGKLLVTFKSENRTYDRLLNVSPRRKSLLSPHNKLSLVPSSFEDIYHFDVCDDDQYETIGESETNDHHGLLPVDAYEVPDPQPEMLNATDQDSFLINFALRSNDVLHSTRHHPPDSKPRCIYRPSIPVTCAIGRVLLRDNSYVSESESKTYYNDCRHSDEKEEEPTQEKWPNVYRGGRRKRSWHAWTHVYLFSKRQRLEKFSSMTTGLNMKSRRLLKLCSPLIVCLQQLTPHSIGNIATSSTEPDVRLTRPARWKTDDGIPTSPKHLPSCSNNSVTSSEKVVGETRRCDSNTILNEFESRDYNVRFRDTMELYDQLLANNSVNDESAINDKLINSRACR